MTVDDDDELYLADQNNPFLAIGYDDFAENDKDEELSSSQRWNKDQLMIASLFSEDDCSKETKENNEPAVAASKLRRNFGLPSFSDQFDRGMTTYTLRRLEDNDDSMTSARTSPSVTVHLEHRKNSTGSDIWDSALVLAHALYRPGILLHPSMEEHSRKPCEVLKGSTVVELGSGTGAVGLFSSHCLGATKVTLTDLESNLDLIVKNKLTNEVLHPSESRNNDRGENRNVIEIVSLDWTASILPPEIQCQPIDLIIGSDLFLPYAPDLLRPLCRMIHRILTICCTSKQKSEETSVLLPSSHLEDDNHMERKRIKKVLSHCPSTGLHHRSMALICYEKRFDCSDFFGEAESIGLVVEKVKDELLHPIYHDPLRIDLLRIYLYSSS